MAINYSLLKIIVSMISVAMLCHWIACLWVLQAKISVRNARGERRMENKFGAPIQNWLISNELCVEKGVNGVEGFEGGLLCTSEYEVYAAALYWAAATITSIGYGDIAATPFNANEQIIGASTVDRTRDLHTAALPRALPLVSMAI